LYLFFSQSELSKLGGLFRLAATHAFPMEMKDNAYEINHEKHESKHGFVGQSEHPEVG